ncbi:MULTISPECIES: phosphoribosylglycinamide formyltransferase [unclassified Beijerinckia]|uniref:phosphoribosylglycinamide formyltransferase n=1 Tax=unclassified Beijerinckia TaxID=2638183 RepID=UPI000898B7F0|nr:MULTISPECIES: phosphoribosylglycinamide formyltransferase [unclassified Beijerinckia]MDH7795685.1 phosphoribosylglycinamide formyltransferase-1 [Beijerinckia sp. GAS462]SEC11793.1 phosphoribosylglycinamide formyltransferase-1 [Beijerinckia sp. 28-YEA-48]
MTMRRRTAILISGRGSNMVSLIEAARAPEYPADISLVLSNRPDAPGLATAKARGIATAAVDHKIYAGREAFEASLQQVLDINRIEFICLAGFMRLLTPSFTAHWTGRMLNIHPALLPSYKGLHTHERALADGVKIHGCTVHFVVPEMDAGPIVAQAAVPVLDTDTPETLGARVLAQEHVIYPRALELAASDRLRIENNRVLGACWNVNHTALVVPEHEDEDG